MNPTTPYRTVVVGASAGGVEALLGFCRGLPAGLQASILIVLHTAPSSPGLLAQILQRVTSLPVHAASHGDKLEPAHIFVARPDRHLLVRDGHLAVVPGPRENRHRPAIDPLFRSAARYHASRVVGIVLSGMGDDGTAGLMAIKSAGGLAIIQDLSEAAFPTMPESAAAQVEVDYQLGVAEMGPLLGELCGIEEGTQAPLQAPSGLRQTVTPPYSTWGADYSVPPVDKAQAPNQAEDVHKMTEPPSGFTCPTCHGALWESERNGLLQFECRVGHVFSPRSLLAEHEESLESALWAALRALEESAALDRRLESYTDRPQGGLAHRYREAAVGKEAQAALLRKLLLEPHARPDQPVE